MQGVRIPVTTYRLQFHAGFTFEQAKQIASYLNRLGVTDVYSSPVLQARKDSLHGYDVTDHAHINPQLGGEEGFEAFSDELRHLGMGMIVDLVPNHMEIDDPVALFADPPLNLELPQNSPAVDAGSPTLAPDRDIRGLPRPWGGSFDLGAYEFTQAIFGDDFELRGP